MNDDRSALIVVVTGLLCAGLFAHGFDSALGQSVTCLLNSFTLILLLLRLQPSVEFWRVVRFPVMLIATAVLWLVVVAAVRATIFPTASEIPYASDLVMPKILSVVAGLWALLIGAMIGWRRQDHHLVTDWVVILVTASSIFAFLIAVPPFNSAFAALSVFERGRFLGLPGNSNVHASVSGAAAILCFAKGLSLWRHQLRVGRQAQRLLGSILAFAFLVNFAAVVLTASRLAIVVTAVSLIILCVYQGHATRWSARRIVLPIGVAIGLASLSMVLFSTLLLYRTYQLGVDASLRWTLWAQAYYIGTGALWTGYGPGAFSQANLYFLKYGQTGAARMIWAINSPHSIFLQLWFVGGAPYVFFVLSGAGLVLRDLCRSLALRSCGIRHVGLILAGGVIFAVATIDIPLDVPASANVALLLVGLGWTAGVSRNRRLNQGSAAFP